jgi:archaeosine-15-forming tRNA-guanine transglycosylase
MDTLEQPELRENDVRFIIEREGVQWIHMAQDRPRWRYLVSGNETSGSTKGEEFLDQLTVSF